MGKKVKTQRIYLIDAEGTEEYDADWLAFSSSDALLSYAEDHIDHDDGPIQVFEVANGVETELRLDLESSWVIV